MKKDKIIFISAPFIRDDRIKTMFLDSHEYKLSYGHAWIPEKNIIKSKPKHDIIETILYYALIIIKKFTRGKK